MRVTKRIEAYVTDEVRKIAATKETAIREKYAPKLNELEEFKESIQRQAEALDKWAHEEMEKRGYKNCRYSNQLVYENVSGIFSPAEKDMKDELEQISNWVKEQAALICVKLEMGGDMETLASLLNDLRQTI